MAKDSKKSLLCHPSFDGTPSGEKLAIAEHLIQCYVAAREGLKQLGMLRSERQLQGDFAEWIVSELLGLRLTESTIEKGYDAVDSNGKTYQVKSRIVGGLKASCSFDFRNIEDRFDYLAGVFLKKSLELLGIILVPYDVVVELGSQTSTTFRFRWNKSVANDPRIEKIYWPKQ